MKLIIIILSIIIMHTLGSCNYSLRFYKTDNGFYKARREYKTNYLSEKHFNTQYFRNNSKDLNLPKYPDSINIIRRKDDFIISYTVQNILIGKDQTEYLCLLKAGLIYPSLFDDQNFSEKQDYSIFIKELNYFRNTITIKRFEILCWYPNYMNPSVYIFELRNKNAIKGTDLKTFVSGAHLSNWKFRGIRI